MVLKTRTKISLYMMALLALLLGLGIQLALTAYTESLARRHGANGLQMLSSVPFNAAREMYEREAEEERQLTEAGARFLSDRLSAAQEGDILILVNAWNPIPEGYKVKLRDIGDGHMLDERCADALLQMVQDCKDAGNKPCIASSYRTMEKQQELFDNKLSRVRASGYSEEWAPVIAAQSVALPGTSEHQVGLAVDLMDEDYPYLNSYQERTSTQRWFMENCWKYGFILRYPNGTTDRTGIIYEPWHYRYVGLETAKEITEMGITLEEYLDLQQPANS